MLGSWFSSKSSRRSQPRRTRSNSPVSAANAQPGHSDASTISQSTVGPLRTPGNLTSISDVPLDDVHTHVNDPSLYATTPSLIHSTEKEAATLETPGPPTTSQDAASHGRDSLRGIFSPERTLFTPQDAVVAQVFGKSVPPVTDSARTTPLPPSNAAQPPASLTTSDSLPPSSGARPSLTLPIYDPFSGVKLGEHTHMSPPTTTPGNLPPFAPFPTRDDRKLWSSLERILELQGEVAVMHADMEGVGGGGPGNIHAGIVSVAEGAKVGPRKRSRRGQTLPVGDEEPEEPDQEGGTNTGPAISEISTEHSDAEDEDEDEDDIRGYGKKRRDEEFARLADQFAKRKAAIGGIMNKLDDLSVALKAFHALPPPLFDFATSSSRTDTLSSPPSNVSVISSPPLHTHQQSSPPLSPIPSSPAVNSDTHSPVPLPPPVPPISTLASPMPLSGPSVPVPVVVPTLPRTAAPTIMPDTPQIVESPADMHPAQSFFQRMS